MSRKYVQMFKKGLFLATLAQFKPLFFAFFHGLLRSQRNYYSSKCKNAGKIPAALPSSQTALPVLDMVKFAEREPAARHGRPGLCARQKGTRGRFPHGTEGPVCAYGKRGRAVNSRTARQARFVRTAKVDTRSVSARHGRKAYLSRSPHLGQKAKSSSVS